MIRKRNCKEFGWILNKGLGEMIKNFTMETEKVFTKVYEIILYILSLKDIKIVFVQFVGYL